MNAVLYAGIHVLEVGGIRVDIDPVLQEKFMPSSDLPSCRSANAKLNVKR